ncbi:MAG: 30S ribosomal protein S6 [SAR202 cluster bacterium]|nr:30S ribosomal protein S6 [SAR202 cluster bacterium]|tara:strand:+ start:1186 stop:1488 length:303 start_codon:yes stop_codon:yes gene_type:complete
MTTKEDRSYEMVLVLSAEIGDEEIPLALEHINQAISDRGGVVDNQENWGRRRLAYPINDQNEGSYIFSRLNLAPEKVVDVDTNLKLQEMVLRHMIIKIDE